MDNTSNALIMAGEILIAILVLSLMAYVFIQFGNFSSEMHETMIETQIEEFNNKFNTYAYRTNITAQEIATIINFAKQQNDSRELVWKDSSPYYVTVYIDGADVFNSNKYIGNNDDYNNNLKLEEILKKFIKENNTFYFSCNATLEKKNNKIDTELYDNDIQYSQETAMINKIEFHSISPDIISIPNSF